MRKLQSQGVHHITLVGADRQTSIDFWEGVLGMPFVFEQPNLDNASESHLYFDPGDGRLITVFTERGARRPTRRRTPTDPGCVHHIAFSLSQATFHQAVERLDERGIQHSGVKDRGFMDSIYFEDPLGLLIELASYRFEPPPGFTHAEVLLEAHKLRVERGDYNIAQVHLADAIEALVARSRESLSDDRSPEGPVLTARGGAHGREHAEHPQAERQQPDRARSSSAPPGSTSRRSTSGARRRRPEFLAKDPAHLTPMLEEDGLPQRLALGELRDHAVPLQQARPRRSFYPTDPGERAMVDSAMFYLIGTLYPLLARATYPTLGFPQYPGEVGDVRRRRRAEGAGRSRTPTAALAEPLERLPHVLPRRQAVHRRRPAVDRRHPPGGDARVPARDRLRLPGLGRASTWRAIEEALGDAYSEPAADVRGYIEYVRSQ